MAKRVGLSLAATVLILLLGCASRQAEVKIHESSHGAVSLERVDNGSYQASHPVSVDSSIIATVLGGLLVQEKQGAVQALLGTVPQPVPVFSEEEIRFLSPLITDAFARASPDERVKFHVAQGLPLGSVITGAWLFIKQDQLYLTLTQYRARSTGSATVYMPNRQLPDPTGLNQFTVSFVPAHALVVLPSERATFFGEPHFTTFEIDYKRLSSSRIQQTANSSIPATRADRTLDRATPSPKQSDLRTESPRASTNQADEAQALKDLVIKKDLEVESLKEELLSVKDQLREQSALVEKLKTELETLKNKRPGKKK
ncbi:MAG TPA: hypothetical protein VGJ57_10350 [Nitrospirales bacterium]